MTAAGAPDHIECIATSAVAVVVEEISISLVSAVATSDRKGAEAVG